MSCPQKKTRICIIVTAPMTLKALYRGQFERLTEQGFEVTAVASVGDAHQAVRERGVKSVAIPMEREPSPLRDLVSLVRLWWFLLFHRFDVVHVSTPKAGLLGALAARLSLHRRVVYTLRGRAYENMTGRKRKVFDLLEKLVCRLSTRVNPIAKELAETIVREGVCKATKVKVIGQGSSNGIDIEQYRLTAELKAKARDIREQAGVGPEDLLLVFVGRIRREKGCNELAYAFESLAKRYPNLHLLMVGTQEPVDPLEECAMAILDEHSRVHRLAWMDDPAAAYAAADIVVFPTYREGFGNVALEAGVLSKPVVASDIMGPREVIEHEVNGLLVKVADTDALAKGMTRLIDDPVLREQYGQAAHAKIVAQYSQPIVWQALVEQYNELVGR